MDDVVGVVGPPHVERVGAHVEHPGGQVGPLDVLAEDQEGHGLVAAHGAEQDPVDALAAGDHPAEPLDAALSRSGLDEVVVAVEPQVVAGLPGLTGDDRPGGAEVLAGGGQRGQDRRIVAFAVEEELDDVLLGRPDVVGVLGRVVPLGELGVDPGNGEQRLPADVLAHRHVHVRIGVDLDDAGRALGPLQVSSRPVDRLGHACEQHRATPFLVFRHVVPVLRFRHHRSGPSARGCSSNGLNPSASTTQVSLLPPPCDELTTRDPSRRATLVRPPRVT